jgi:pimeloyl-ACP methyl ester carboxylesterase
MPRAATNGIELEYETFGDPADEPLLLVSGHGAQLVWWEEDFCAGLVDRGFFVIRFDNRDVGKSTRIDGGEIDLMAAITKALSGDAIEAPYTLADMAADAWGLLDALGIGSAHLVGASMGGMIAQEMAIAEPERVRSLTSIMSTTGDPDAGGPHPEVLDVILAPSPSEREAYIDDYVEGGRAISSPDFFDEDLSRRRGARTYDRGFNPAGVTQQLMAIMASGSRSDALRQLDIEALVIHGDLDPLVDVSGGERTAECLRGSELLILDGMGHDLPTHYWSRLIEAICAVAARAPAKS